MILMSKDGLIGLARFSTSQNNATSHSAPPQYVGLMRCARGRGHLDVMTYLVGIKKEQHHSASGRTMNADSSNPSQAIVNLFSPDIVLDLNTTSTSAAHASSLFLGSTPSHR